jgi:hypothetical protein
MSTHRIERRRIKPIGRRLELRRLMSVIGVLIGVFAIAFGVGHIRRSSPEFVERTPPRLPVVATPVSASLASAPAIKVAVAKPPPPKPSKAAKSSIAPVAPVTPVTTTPEATTPAVTPTPTPTPAPTPTVTPPTHSSTPAPKSSSGGGGGGGSGSGTSFESSG